MHTTDEEPSQSSTCQPRLGLARVVVRNLYTILDTARYISRIMLITIRLTVHKVRHRSKGKAPVVPHAPTPVNKKR
jgi:hypothetical protein